MSQFPSDESWSLFWVEDIFRPSSGEVTEWTDILKRDSVLYRDFEVIDLVTFPAKNFLVDCRLIILNGPSDGTPMTPNIELGVPPQSTL